MKTIPTSSRNGDSSNRGIADTEAIQLGETKAIRRGLESFEAWSNWFHRDTTAAVRSESHPEPGLRSEAEETVMVTPEPVVVRSKGRRQVQSDRMSASAAGLACEPRVRQARTVETRKAASPRRAKLVRPRRFDDWSNWFWQSGWPAATA